MAREWIPVIDLAPFGGDSEATAAIAASVQRACRESGFFYVVGHGVDSARIARLESSSRRFFELPLEQKLEIDMRRGGRAWRGYFPVGRELTSGRPDHKEGIYFGSEFDNAHPKVRAGIPLHGKNLFPDEPPELRGDVLAYMAELTALGHRIVEAIASSLGLEREYFSSRYTRDPFVLFRIFHYPSLPAQPPPREEAERWSVGEHTDYGLLTIVHQDDSGGLEVESPAGWIPAPPVPGSFVCNLGDMLDKMTGGFYRSTAHRVRHRHPGGRGRLSFPFFFDPALDATIEPIDPDAVAVEDGERRWDRSSVHAFRGKYGDYLIAKLARVFPGLGRDVL